MRNNDAILQPQRKSLKREVFHISVYSISDEHYYENLMSFPCHIPKQKKNSNIVIPQKTTSTFFKINPACQY